MLQLLNQSCNLPYFLDFVNGNVQEKSIEGCSSRVAERANFVGSKGGDGLGPTQCSGLNCVSLLVSWLGWGGNAGWANVSTFLTLCQVSYILHLFQPHLFATNMFFYLVFFGLKLGLSKILLISNNSVGVFLTDPLQPQRSKSHGLTTMGPCKICLTLRKILRFACAY